MTVPTPAELRSRYFVLDPEVTFLNHGSFGACPRKVLDAQAELRQRMESEPVRFFVRDLPELVDAARREVAAFVGARPENLAFVRNATAGVNAVLRSISLAPGDEVLTTDHAYNACRNALVHVATRAGAAVITAKIPFPIADPAQAASAILGAVTDRTRLALIDHVTSPTGLILPIEEIVCELAARGVDTLVDGAHGPGMLPLQVEALGAAYYTGNFHKWCCAPKGAGMLWVREDRKEGLHPAVVSHGYNAPTTTSRFQLEFDWTGTDDPTPWLCVPDAIRLMGSLLPGGWPEVRRRNRERVLAGRALLCQALKVEAPAPASMIGSLAAIPLPPGDPTPPTSALYLDPLQLALFDRYGIEVPVPPWPAPPARLLRISAQVYNEAADYERLAAVIGQALADDARERAGRC